jgi:general secretion pathway protein E
MIETLINPELITKARKCSLISGRCVTDELISLLVLPERETVTQISLYLGIPILENGNLQRLKPVLEEFPLALSARHCALLLHDGEEKVLAVSDPFHLDFRTWAESNIDAPFSYRLALRSDILDIVDRLSSQAKTMEPVSFEQDPSGLQDENVSTITFESVGQDVRPAVKLVNSALYDALKVGASDIHFETTPSGLQIRFRIDGVLDSATTIHSHELAERVISRVKVLAELDIAERRIPQDGSFRVNVDTREIDLRVSIMPSIHGEDAVVRILDKQAMINTHGSLSLESLGFDADSLISLRGLVQNPYGMLLVTGPTGSGKTTTLYAALTEIHDGREKIITIEDPVEYQLPGILQIPVNEKKGLTFATGLRSILRHDPDKIMIGEIRDHATAEIAVQSALTGHLVLTTVHANNVFDVFGRFAHMGVDPYSFVSALNGIWAQRLIRINCSHCAYECAPVGSDIAKTGLSEKETSDYIFRRGKGCRQCRGSGYRGRNAIAEILTMNDEIREAIIGKLPLRRIKELAWNNGTKNLRSSALELVKAGLTTLEEVRRVTLHA